MQSHHLEAPTAITHTKPLPTPPPNPKKPLRYNTSFKTDEERLYHVGMVAALDRKARTGARARASVPLPWWWL
jgi:hypothetical protein